MNKTFSSQLGPYLFVRQENLVTISLTRRRRILAVYCAPVYLD